MRSDPPARARLLLLEHRDHDADLLLTHLRRGRCEYGVERAVGRAGFESALGREPADVVLADYSLPDFDGLTALRLTRERWPGVPFIFVSGVLGEDIATQAVREGATPTTSSRSATSASSRASVERALAETRERENRQRAEMLFRMAAEAADIGIWELDVERRTLWFDDGMRALLGFGPRPLPGLDALDCSRPSSTSTTGRACATLLAPTLGPDGRAEFEYAHRAVHQRSGRVCWLAIKGRRISGPDNRVRLVGTARDVTEERRRDEALRQANVALEERVAARTRERDRMWNLSVDLMHDCRPDGTLDAVNPAWERLLGWRSGQLEAAPPASSTSCTPTTAPRPRRRCGKLRGRPHAAGGPRTGWRRATAARVGSAGPRAPTPGSCTRSGATSPRSAPPPTASRRRTANCGRRSPSAAAWRRRCSRCSGSRRSAS